VENTESTESAENAENTESAEGAESTEGTEGAAKDEKGASSKLVATRVSDYVASDFKNICEHHGSNVSRVIKMLIWRVIDHPERVPAAMEEYEEKHGKGNGEKD
jgi:hypothetical protein